MVCGLWLLIYIGVFVMSSESKVSLIVSLAVIILLVTAFGLSVSLYQIFGTLITNGKELFAQKLQIMIVFEIISFTALLALSIFLIFLLSQQKKAFKNYFILFSILYIGLHVGHYYLAKIYVWEIYEISLEFRNAALASIRNAAKMTMYSSVIIVGLLWSKKAKKFFAK